MALTNLPGRSVFKVSTRAHAVSGLFTLTCPNADSFIFSPRSGAFGASWVPRRISSCMPRPDDSAGSPQPSPSRLLLYCLRCALKPSASGTDYVEAVPALQGTRLPLRPTGFSVYACLTSCSQVTPLLIKTKTRYGWVASPYPTGTFTLQDAPGFAQRDNACRNRRICSKRSERKMRPS